MKELNETIKNILMLHKNQAYVIDEKRYGFSLCDGDYKKVTNVDLTTLGMEHGNINVYGEIRYCKNDEGCIELQYETMIFDKSQDSLSGVIVAPDVKEDYLELFSTEQEKNMDWNKYTKIVLQDVDKHDEVVGILFVDGLTADEVEKIFSDVKYEEEGYWTFDDLVEGVRKTGKEVIYLTGDIYIYGA